MAQSLHSAQFLRMMKELQPDIRLWNESRKTEMAAAASRWDLLTSLAFAEV